MIRIRRAGGALVLLALSIGLLWKLALGGGQFTWLNSPDLSSQVLPWFNLEARAWHARQLPLWDNFNWGGQPLAGRTEPGVMYPPNWLLFSLPLADSRIAHTALHWYYVLAHYLGALFFYLLCRDLGRSVAASVLAGAVFGMGGWLGSTGWPQMVNGAVWAPLVLLFFLRALDGRRPLRSAALAGTFFGVSLLAGHHQIPTFVMLMLAALWCWRLVEEGWPVRRFAALAGAFALFALLAGAAQVLPSLEYGRLSVRWVGSPQDPLGWQDKVPYLVHSRWALNPVSLLGVVVPGVHPHANPYMGFAVVGLALTAVAVLWRRREVRLFGGIAAGGFLFSLGAASLVHGLIYALAPMAEKARNVSMACFLSGMGLAMLAAFGLDAMAEEAPRAAPVARRLAVALWIAAGLIFAVLLVVFVVQAGQVFNHSRVASAGVAALLAGGAFYGYARGSLGVRAARVLLVALAVHELGNVAGADILERAQGWQYLDQMAADADIAAYLKAQPDLFRVDVERQDIPYNFGEWYEIEETGGNSGVTANIWRVNGEANALALLGRRFSVRRTANQPDMVESFTGASGVKVFFHHDAFPRVWTVHQVRSVGRMQIREEIGGPREELWRRTFVVGAAPELQTCEADGDEARLVERGHARVVIRARMGCRGMVILADTWYPGWQARVDGRLTPIHEAYGFLRGVVVERGEHTLEFRYRPASVYGGMALSAAALLAVAVLLIAPARRAG